MSNDIYISMIDCYQIWKLCNGYSSSKGHVVVSYTPSHCNVENSSIKPWTAVGVTSQGSGIKKKAYGKLPWDAVSHASALSGPEQ